MEALFQNQEEYDRYLHGKKIVFEKFLETMRFEIIKHIPSEDIRLSIKPIIVLQSKKKNQMYPEQPPKDVPYEYFGFGDLILYSWIWSELTFDHNIHISDANVINEDGDIISNIGSAGFDAGETTLMDYSVDYDDRIENLSSSEIESFGSEDLAGDETSKSWVEDLFGDGEDFDIDFG